MRKKTPKSAVTPPTIEYGFTIDLKPSDTVVKAITIVDGVVTEQAVLAKDIAQIAVAKLIAAIKKLPVK